MNCEEGMRGGQPPVGEGWPGFSFLPGYDSFAMFAFDLSWRAAIIVAA